MAWTYGGWRREATTTAQRTMLIQHIEEVEAILSGYKSQGAMQQSAARFELEDYLRKLEKKLTEYDDSLGLGLDADFPAFIQAKPRTNDSLETA